MSTQAAPHSARVIPWRDFESAVHAHCFDLIEEATGKRFSDYDWKRAWTGPFADVLRAGYEPGVSELIGAVLGAIDTEDSDE